MSLLTVRGRTSGRDRTTPVSIFEHNGERYLFGTFGDTQWVRNLRVAGEAVLARGQHRSRVVSLLELRRPLERGRGLGVTTAVARKRRTSFQLVDERGIRLLRGRCQVPGTALTTSACERLVSRAAEHCGGVVIDGRAEKWMLEGEARPIDNRQAGALRSVERVGLEASASDRSDDLVEVG